MKDRHIGIFRKMLFSAGVVLWLANGAAASCFYFGRNFLGFSAALSVFLILGVANTLRLAASGLTAPRQLTAIFVFWLPIFPSLFAERFIPAQGAAAALLTGLRIAAGEVLIWAVVTGTKKRRSSRNHGNPNLRNG